MIMPEEKSIPKRLMSLDAFRGFTIIAMLMVNNAGYDAAFPDQFRHAPWGKMVTFCDMIFPWFLFIVGVAIPFSAASFRSKNPSRAAYLLKALKRAILLIFFGILIDSSIGKRIAIGMNVLQLIGLAYFCAALIYELPKKTRGALIPVLLLIYGALLRWVPVPQIGAGVFEEGKTIIHFINKKLAPYHLAGIPSVIPTTALVLIGTFIGESLKDKDASVSKKLGTLYLAGLILTLIGIFWHFEIPMSKHIWTPSYIIFTAGVGCIVLGIFYDLIDITGYKKWAFPFIIYGMNAITAYFFSIMVRVHTVQEWFTHSATGEKITLWQAILDFWTNLAGMTIGSWLFTFSYIFFWWLVLLWMFKKKLFLRV